MAEGNQCSEDGCTSPAVGYVPLDEDFPVCGEHFDEKQRQGILVCFFSEEVCPECQGRSLRPGAVGCVTCASAGVVERRQQKRCCTKCGGSGEAPPMGRPRGSYKRPVSLAA